MELPTTPRTEIVVRRTPCEAKVKSKWIEASKVNDLIGRLLKAPMYPC